MNLLAKIIERRHRPMLIIGVAVMVYLWFFSMPHLWRSCRNLWDTVISFPPNTLASNLFCFGAFTAELLGLLAGLVIWIFSILIAWAAFRKSRKTAYIFILAYFLLPLVTTPTASMFRKAMLARETREQESHRLTQDPEIAQRQEVTPKTMTVTTKIHIPIGEFLLLAGIWYLYKKEETADAEHNLGDDNRKAAPPG